MHYGIKMLLFFAFFVLLLTGIWAAGYVERYVNPVGYGFVIDSRSGEPIPGAEVHISYRIPKFHGTKTGDFELARTDSVGRFAFSRELEHKYAGNIFLDVRKAGYVETGLLDIDYRNHWERVSRRVHLTREEHANLQRIDARTDVMDRNWIPAWKTYAIIYREFLEAKAIATTDEERNYVRDLFCPRLMAEWGSMSAEQKAEESGRRVWPDGQIVPGASYLDHELTVEFCGS